MNCACRVLAVTVCLLLGSCAPKELSSVCVSGVRADADTITLMAVLEPKLPSGATVGGVWSSDVPERKIIQYRDRVYEVSVRADGSRTCFVLTPPIPLRGEPERQTSGRASAADRLAVILTDYWYIIPGVVLAAWVFTKQRKSEPVDEHTDQKPGN